MFTTVHRVTVQPPAQCVLDHIVRLRQRCIFLRPTTTRVSNCGVRMANIVVSTLPQLKISPHSFVTGTTRRVTLIKLSQIVILTSLFYWRCYRGGSHSRKVGRKGKGGGGGGQGCSIRLHKERQNDESKGTFGQYKHKWHQWLLMHKVHKDQILLCSFSHKALVSYIEFEMFKHKQVILNTPVPFSFRPFFFFF